MLLCFVFLLSAVASFIPCNGCTTLMFIFFAQAVLARVSALVAAQKEPKPAHAKKLRGKKKVTATSEDL